MFEIFAGGTALLALAYAVIRGSLSGWFVRRTAHKTLARWLRWR